MRKNVAGQRFFVHMKKSADGSPFTDTASVSVAKDAAAAAAITGSITHLTGGMYRCDPSQADTNGDYLGFVISGTGALSVVANFDTRNFQSDVLAWEGSTSAVKTGSTSGLPEVDVTAWQDRILTGANMIENNAGDDRFTTKALEQAPSGGGSSPWTAADVEGARYRWNLNGVRTAPTEVPGDPNVNATNMRGTDNALLASAAPANFGDLSITATTGRIDLGSWKGSTPDDLTTGLVKASTENAVTVAGTVDANMVNINGVTADFQQFQRNVTVQANGTVNDASATATSFVTTITGFAVDTFKGRSVIFEDGLSKQAGSISGYAADGTFTIVAGELTAAPPNGSKLIVV